MIAWINVNYTLDRRFFSWIEHDLDLPSWVLTRRPTSATATYETLYLTVCERIIWRISNSNSQEFKMVNDDTGNLKTETNRKTIHNSAFFGHFFLSLDSELNFNFSSQLKYIYFIYISYQTTPTHPHCLIFQFSVLEGMHYLFYQISCRA